VGEPADPVWRGEAVPGAPCSCAMSRPCTENRLTRPSSSGRTHHEHARSFRSQGCQTEDGSGVGCLRNISKLKHDVAPEKCALPQENRALSPRMQPRARRVIDAALAIVHLHAFCRLVLRPRDTHRVDIRLNVSPIVFAIIQNGYRWCATYKISSMIVPVSPQSNMR